MSTRATVKIYNENNKVLVTIYKHWDGYPDGFGKELREICDGQTLVNGIGNDRQRVSNGMDCFAATLIASIKREAGDVYICLPGRREEYNYKIKPKGNQIKVTCDEEPGW